MQIHRIAKGLSKTPLVTIACVLALGLALGATTLVYSVVDGVLLKTLPYRDPDRLVVVWETNAPRGRFENVAAPANFLHWQDAARTLRLASVTMHVPRDFRTAGPARGSAQSNCVSGRLFEIVGVDAAAGRTFTPEEDRPGNDVALISHRLWQRRFGGDAAIVGRRMQISGEPRTIVGVMPPGFSVLDPTVDVWMPMRLRRAGTNAARTVAHRHRTPGARCRRWRRRKAR